MNKTETGIEVVKVLLVEDSPTEAMLIQAVLEETDFPTFSTMIVGTLAEAIECLALEDHCDIVVLDLTLPDSSGLATYQSIRQRFPEIPVVVVTANNSKSMALEAIQIGAQDFIVKEQVENMALGLSLRFAIERKRGENDIKRRQKNLETVIKATPVGMLLIDENMRIEMANEAVAELVGMCYQDLLGKTLDEGLRPQQVISSEQIDQNEHSVTHLTNICRQVLESGQAVLGLETQETFVINQREFRFWLHVCCNPALIDERNHVILALNDVTAKMEGLEIKNRVMSMVSHELRSPLGAMKEATEIVLEELPGPLNDQQREMLDIVKRNLERLHRLTDDFLDLQKLKAGKLSFSMVEGDLNAMIEEVAATMKSAAASQGVELIVDLDRSIPMLVFDKDRLVQVFVNLINNSLKFTEHGSITLTTNLSGDVVRLSIKDTGCGMPSEEIPKLFQEFRQLSNTRKGGTGLGLSIAKRIVEEHQGVIEVSSQLNQGTTLSVVLPVR